jgi:hypothetical protein
MQFAIGVTVLECFFVKHSHGPLGVKIGRIASPGSELDENSAFS